MKLKEMLITVIVTLSIMLSGCAYLNWDDIIDTGKDIIEDINDKDDNTETNAPPVVEEPEEPDEQETPDDSLIEQQPAQAINLDYSKNWILVLKGEFPLNSHKRIIQTGPGPRYGLDLFIWHNKLAIRLYNEKIRFSNPILGSISTPQPPNHWSQTIPLPSKIHKGTHTLVYQYTLLNAAMGKLECWYDDIGMMNVQFDIRTSVPNRNKIYFRGFVGECKFEILD